MSDRMTSRLVVDALAMAVQFRLPKEGLLAHSDRGSQYASEHYRRLLAKMDLLSRVYTLNWVSTIRGELHFSISLAGSTPPFPFPFASKSG